MKYKIGDKVWMAQFNRYAMETITCPDCQGDRYLTVIMGDGNIIEMPCSLCEKRIDFGYDNYSCGYKEIHVCKPSVELREITGIEIKNDGSIEYKLLSSTGGHYCPNEDKLFDNKEDAVKESERLAELDRLYQINEVEKRKHDSKRTWAWNVRYHKAEIKRCKSSLEHHERKLYFAKQNNKVKDKE